MKKKIPFFTHSERKLIPLDAPLDIPPNVSVLVFTEQGTIEKQTAPIIYNLNDMDEVVSIGVTTDYKNGYIILN